MANKITLSVIKDYEECNQKLFELGKIEQRITKQESNMNARIEKIKSEFDERTLEDREKKAVLNTQIENFLISNKSDFIETRKKQLTHGMIGFQTTPPKVTFLNRKYNNNTVIELLNKIFSGKYVDKKESIDKDGILAGLAGKELTDEKLAAVGLKVDQSEKIIIDINWESFPESEVA